MLMRLLKDVWFYISAGGFLASLLLFVFLLGQYRIAVEAEEDTEDGSLEVPPIIEEAPALKKVLAVESREPALATDEPAEPVLEVATVQEKPTASASSLSEKQEVEEKIERRPIPEAAEQTLSELSREMRILNEGMTNFVGEIKSLENVLTEQSQKSLKVLSQISTLLMDQKRKADKTAAVTPSSESSASQELEEKTPAKTKMKEEEPVPTEKPRQEEPMTEPLKLEIPKTAERTIFIEPTTVSGVKKIDEGPQEETTQVLPAIEENPSQKSAPSEKERLKGQLKLKGPEDIDALSLSQGEPIQPRKGPVWPI